MKVTDWKSLIEESLRESVQAAEENIASHPAVSEWMTDAAYEAAAGPRGAGDRTGMQAYHELSERFEETFAPLFEAVQTVTHGCGRLVLDWQPGDPRHTGVRIDFGQEFPVHIYEHIRNMSEDEADRFLARLAGQLPRGAPYPKKPHRVGAVLSDENGCFSVRLLEAVTDANRRRRFVSTYSGGKKAKSDIPVDDAAAHIVSLVNSSTAAERPD